jgi:hypothetical protein
MNKSDSGEVIYALRTGDLGLIANETNVKIIDIL